VRVIGERQGLDPEITMLLDEAETLTAGNEKLNLVIAFNYGSRDEIVRAARKAALAVKSGAIAVDAIGVETFSGFLDTVGIPDPDLVIRTSGELRLSNFLLWQAAYAELIFLPCYWPDFGRADLAAALGSYARRERRFGGVDARDVAI
jgi:undecaprenyl diphosphate synthase